MPLISRVMELALCLNQGLILGWFLNAFPSSEFLTTQAGRS